MYRCKVASEVDFKETKSYDIFFKGHRRPVAGRCLIKFEEVCTDDPPVVLITPLWVINSKPIAEDNSLRMVTLSTEEGVYGIPILENTLDKPLCSDGLRWTIYSKYPFTFHIQASFEMR